MSVKKRYPQGFYDDGFGDILDWIDDEVLIHSEKKLSSNRNAKSSKSSKGRVEHDLIESDLETGRDGILKNKKKKLKIYGDNDLNKVLQNKNKRTEVDIPLDLSEPDDKDTKQKLNKSIEDKARGLINRLAAKTIPYVAGEFQKLYSGNSRTDLNMAIYNNIESSVLLQSSLAKRKMVAELMILISYLDHKISHNIGATIVHRLVRQLETLYRDDTSDADKRLDNTVFCLVNLYVTGLLSANVIFELTKRICSAKDFRPKSIELLLIILKNVGFQLRKENPRLMKQLIFISYEQCKQLKTDTELSSRVEFIFEALEAIKNNNMKKIGNYGCDIDKDAIESTLRSLIQRTKLPESLNDATYAEILNSNNWYLLDTRIAEANQESVNDLETKMGKEKKGNKSENKICKSLGLSKPAERTIFGALIRASDYIEASNIIIGYGLNYCSDSMVVVTHVASYEKKYNPFYHDVINSLCKFNRKYKMAAKFAIQDKIRALGDMQEQRAAIFGRLCFELIRKDAIPITVLKSVEWADLSDSTKQFLTYLLESVSALPENEKRQIMIKSDRRSSFAGAMRTFADCFLKDCQLFE